MTSYAYFTAAAMALTLRLKFKFELEYGEMSGVEDPDAESKETVDNESESVFDSIPSSS